MAACTHERLRDTIARRMHMKDVVQPLMLSELLGRRSPAPAQDVARRILVGGEELSDAEREELLQLCRQRLDQGPSAHPRQRPLRMLRGRLLLGKPRINGP